MSAKTSTAKKVKKVKKKAKAGSEHHSMMMAGPINL
jgi:hypothetical protein